jgi:hypothetical protein
MQELMKDEIHAAYLGGLTEKEEVRFSGGTFT